MNISVVTLRVAAATKADAAGMVQVIHAAFGARPQLDPPSTAGQETEATVRAQVEAGAGVYATVDDQPAGAILLHPVTDRPTVGSWHRVSVHPEFQRHGIATAMVGTALEQAAELGYRAIELFVREEFAELVEFWRRLGFVVDRAAPHGLMLRRSVPVTVRVPTADRMKALGARLADLLRPGDLVIASGELGAGKTTLTQGIGRGLGSVGGVISPTFVLSRIHPTAAGRPTLVHVDAYRLSSPEELDDLDLDATLAEGVTVIEWGTGLAEDLADHRLEIEIRRSSVTTGELPVGADQRLVILRPIGERWAGVDLTVLQELGADTSDQLSSLDRGGARG